MPGPWTATSRLIYYLTILRPDGVKSLHGRDVL